MARKKKDEEIIEAKDDLDAFTKELIDGINSSRQDKIAFNLESDDDAPTNISRFISSGSKLLDFILSGKFFNGGFPAGRVVEIYGKFSSGKSHLATQIIKSAQEDGGIGIYVDAENATSKENLKNLGINLKRLVFAQSSCVEEIFEIAEETIKKANAMNKDAPIVFCIDSIAAASSQEELLAGYDKSLIGVKARSLSKGFRKITNTIGNHKVLFICLNQIRENISITWGSNHTTPGGQALKFASSQRLELVPTGKLKDKEDKVYGINVKAKTVKNKVFSPHRECEFEIHFGIGIKEYNQIFNLIKKEGKVQFENYEVSVGDGAWKSLLVKKNNEVLVDEKFRKDELENVFKKYENIVNKCLEKILYGKVEISVDNQNLIEIESLNL